MAFDIANFPTGLLMEMRTDVLESEQALADTFCDRITKPTSLAGELSVRGGGVWRGENQDLSPGEEAKPYQYENATFAYSAKAQVGYGFVTKEELMNADAFFDEDAAQNEMKNARGDANTALDRKLATELLATTTTYDVSVAGSGEWSDGGTTSKMALDIRTVREVNANGADTCIIGRNLRNIMLDHTDLVTTAATVGGGGNNATAGTTDESVLVAWLKRVCKFKNVYIFEKQYETAGVGGTSSLSYLFDNSMWIGHKNNLVLVHPNHKEQDGFDVNPVVRRRGYEFQHDRYDFIGQVVARKSCLLTNLIA